MPGKRPSSWPDPTDVRGAGGGRSRTAAALAAEGLGKGDRLALLSHNCWQFAVLSFATARLGVVLVPVNFMLGPGEIAIILGHAQAAAFVAEDGLAATAGKAIEAAGLDVPVRAVIRLRGDEVPDGWADLQRWIDREGTPPQVDIGDDDLVRLMYPPAPSPGRRARC